MMHSVLSCALVCLFSYSFVFVGVGKKEDFLFTCTDLFLLIDNALYVIPSPSFHCQNRVLTLKLSHVSWRTSSSFYLEPPNFGEIFPIFLKVTTVYRGNSISRERRATFHFVIRSTVLWFKPLSDPFPHSSLELGCVCECV